MLNTHTVFTDENKAKETLEYLGETDEYISYAIDIDGWTYTRSASVINKAWIIHMYDEGLNHIADL